MCIGMLKRITLAPRTHASWRIASAPLPPAMARLLVCTLTQCVRPTTGCLRLFYVRRCTWALEKGSPDVTGAKMRVGMMAWTPAACAKGAVCAVPSSAACMTWPTTCESCTLRLLQSAQAIRADQVLQVGAKKAPAGTLQPAKTAHQQSGIQQAQRAAALPAPSALQVEWGGWLRAIPRAAPWAVFCCTIILWGRRVCRPWAIS
mmetsp:Transcript_17305/g.45348  ORF Transcript_17305/g.45348 Transcript_17305/m.45348 type:complete len:204 (-) Transcript_17305:148-759(-)